MAYSSSSRYFAAGDHALSNGSYIRADKSTFVQYMNGDFVGEYPMSDWQYLPIADFKTYTPKEARALLPKVCR